MAKTTIIRKRFGITRCACGKDNDAIEARYMRLSGAFDHEGKSTDLRLPSERDRDRVLYSSSFRRLGEITQVIPRERGHLLHNRLTHSLKVAQLGRRMAERLLSGGKGDVELANELGGLDPSVVETAALAHDLGHPPFGHIIEEYLDEKIDSEEPDGYEGNAQTFRILTFLENRDIAANRTCGLDLTLASLNATLKYPWARETGPGRRGIRTKKFGYYSNSPPDKDHFKLVRERLSESCGGDGLRSLEAELMDWADDIAYAIYDIDDFFRAGLIPLDKILRECWEFGAKAFVEADNEMHYLFTETRNRWNLQLREESEIAKLDSYFEVFCGFMLKVAMTTKVIESQIGNSGVTLPAVSQAKRGLLALRTAYRATDDQRRALATFTSSLVEQFTSAIGLNANAVNNRHIPKVVIDSEIKTVVKILKELTWTYVIDSPGLHAVQEGQKQIVDTVFVKLLGDHDDSLRLIPKSVREMFRAELSQGQHRRRHVCDIVASMTETQIADLYARFTGNSPGSLLHAGFMV